jgi:hypothetical protein
MQKVGFKLVRLLTQTKLVEIDAGGAGGVLSKRLDAACAAPAASSGRPRFCARLEHQLPLFCRFG